MPPLPIDRLALLTNRHAGNGSRRRRFRQNAAQRAWYARRRAERFGRSPFSPR